MYISDPFLLFCYSELLACFAFDVEHHITLLLVKLCFHFPIAMGDWIPKNIVFDVYFGCFVVPPFVWPRVSLFFSNDLLCVLVIALSVILFQSLLCMLVRVERMAGKLVAVDLFWALISVTVDLVFMSHACLEAVWYLVVLFLFTVWWLFWFYPHRVVLFEFVV